MRKLHAQQGFQYQFPDLDDPAFVVGCVDECDGDIVAAAFLKLGAEAYLLMDAKAGTPYDRWASLMALHHNVEVQARKIGLQDVHCWIPPELSTGRYTRPSFWQRIRAAWHCLCGRGCDARTWNTARDSAFIRRLKRKGWSEDQWRNLTYRLRD